jgi:Dolichyl-phosphate-mannose-protein mannosyltransferase
MTTVAQDVDRRFDIAGLRVCVRPSLVLCIASLAIHLLVNGRYGFFRDELYFIVCGDRPAWGYVDQPPLIPLIAAWSHALFGNFLLGFRLAPMLAMTATVALTTEFARILGGGRFAQWLSGLCVLCGGIFLAEGLLLTTDLLQPLTWLACSWFLVRLAQTGDQRWWIPFGIVVGISLLTKYLIAFYLLALAIGFAFTPLRHSLARIWIYAGTAIALLMVLPNVLWQQQNDWPFLQMGVADVIDKNIALSPPAFFLQQLMLIGPAAMPVWLAGLWTTSIRPAHPAFRGFSVAYVVLCLVFIACHGKAYYLAPIYPTLLAFGATAIERRLGDTRARRWALAVVAAVGAFLSPLAVPVLRIKNYVAFAKDIGFVPSAFAAEHHKLGLLPQHFADMFGWPEMAAKIASVYDRLPPADRAKAVFFGRNYGEAAAIDVLGRSLGLPPAISGQNNYFLWGPRGHDGSVVIVIGGNRDQMMKQFRSVDQVGYINTPYAIPEESDKPIYVLRGSKTPLATMWPKLRKYE